MLKESMEATKPDPNPVKNNQALQRFEIATPQGTAVLDYQLKANTLYLTHAEVPHAARGGGLAGQLTAFAMQWARARDLKVVPVCRYVAAYIARHPEYLDLMT
jgi:predicted GNAT family acetyltransferase